MKDEIMQMIRCTTTKGTWKPNQPFRIKFAGDGTHGSRISSFTSFAVFHVPKDEVLNQTSAEHLTYSSYLQES